METAARASLPRSQAGFTLIEIVVGLAILVIALLGLTAAIIASLQAGRVAREHGIALSAAETRMTELRSSTESELLALGATSTFAVSGLVQRADGTPVGEVTIDATRRPLYRLVVWVRWRGPYGNEQLQLESRAVP